jgi:hypothetical protein
MLSFARLHPGQRVRDAALPWTFLTLNAFLKTSLSTAPITSSAPGKGRPCSQPGSRLRSAALEWKCVKRRQTILAGSSLSCAGLPIILGPVLPEADPFLSLSGREASRRDGWKKRCCGPTAACVREPPGDAPCPARPFLALFRPRSWSFTAWGCKRLPWVKP